MNMPAALPQVRPISDLRTRLPEIESRAKATGEPIIMTKNGTAALVVMDSETFDEHLAHERAVRKLREAEIEAQYRTEPIPYEAVKARIDDILGSIREAYAAD